jgi:hypothetical protein
MVFATKSRVNLTGQGYGCLMDHDHHSSFDDEHLRSSGNDHAVSGYVGRVGGIVVAIDTVAVRLPIGHRLVGAAILHLVLR